MGAFPRVTGIEVLHRLRAQPETRDAAVIMTGYAFVLQEAGVDLAQYDVLLKPISPEELLYSVEKMLATRS